MKRAIVLLVLGMVVFHPLKAQNWDEWFRQRKTQRKYLLEQIAALKVYLGFLEKGYNIVNKGLTTIHNIKNGDFNLHHDFFNSLKAVNPAIGRWTKVADIVACQYRIIRETKAVLQRIGQDGIYSAAEIKYVKNIFDHVLDECAKNIEELVMVTTSGEMEMKDDQRIECIDKIYSEMQDKYVFIRSFGQDIVSLSLQRQAEENEAAISKVIDGIE